MKLRYAAILGGLLLVLCSIWILGTASSFNACKANQTAAMSEEAKENSPPLTRSVINRAAICARCAIHVVYEYRDAATAVATVFIALFTFTLWGATIKLADADRPHIFPGHFSIKGVNTNEPVVVGFNFENSGRSPAYLENFIFGACNANKLPKRPNFKRATTHDMFFGSAPGKILFPGGEAKADIPLTPEIRAQVLAGTTTLFVFGRINFRETSGKRHFQGFAYRYDVATNTLFNSGPGSYWDHS
jgi:hypothetical protein